MPLVLLVTLDGSNGSDLSANDCIGFGLILLVVLLLLNLL